MLHFSLKCSSFLQILSLSRGRFYRLQGIAITTGDWWNQKKNKKKTVKTISIIIKNGGNEQIAYYAPEISQFFSCHD